MAIVAVIQKLSLSNKRKNFLLRGLDDVVLCIQDSPNLPISINLDSYEKLFFDNLNNDYDDDDELFSSDIVS